MLQSKNHLLCNKVSTFKNKFVSLETSVSALIHYESEIIYKLFTYQQQLLFKTWKTKLRKLFKLKVSLSQAVILKLAKDWALFHEQKLRKVWNF